MGPDAASRKHIMNFSMICINVLWKGRDHKKYSREGRALEIVLGLQTAFLFTNL